MAPFHTFASEQENTSRPVARPDVTQRVDLRRRGELEKLTLGLGVNFSRGDYRVDRSTDVISSVLRLNYARKDWSISMSVPYLHIDGPADVFAISDGDSTEFFASDERDQRRGIGDLRISAQHDIPSLRSRHSRYFLGGMLKLPTADEEEQLGTGEMDHSLFFGGLRRNGRWVGNARLGYLVMGDSEFTDYNNRWFTSIGASYLPKRGQSIGLSYHYKQSSTDQSEAIRVLSASCRWRLSKGWRFGVNAGTGFSESSADYFAGFQISRMMSRRR